MPTFLLLDEFRKVFEGSVYRPRSSTKGDQVASFLYEDLFNLSLSKRFTERVVGGSVVVNTGNTIRGKKGRRGDGTLGEIVPQVVATPEAGFSVKRGPVAQLEIGAEAKFLATKMIAQIDRVMNDLREQQRVFKKLSADVITIGIVGVNHASEFTSALGANSFDARVPPAKEAAEVVRRLRETVEPLYDELLILNYRATNRPPYAFEWVNDREAQEEYGSILTRIARQYDKRF